MSSAGRKRLTRRVTWLSSWLDEVGERREEWRVYEMIRYLYERRLVGQATVWYVTHAEERKGGEQTGIDT